MAFSGESSKHKRRDKSRGRLSPTVKASLELLGVNQEATLPELKKAYHRLALLYHPDRNPRAEAAHEFQKVTEAYELLCDRPRVEDLNRRHLREKLHRQVVEGIQITFGSFFGFRLFDLPGGAPAGEPELLNGRIDASPRDPGQKRDATPWLKTEESNSILDHAAYDGLEVVYAGKLSSQDENFLKGGFDGTQLSQMPWVVLNNQGILHYLEGDLKGARKCYHELCLRVPNNIVFMYRLGLCHILDGFKSPQRTFFGGVKPDRLKIEKGIEILKACIRLGEDRTFGRQKCLVIRKVLADVYERTGQGRKARKVWRAIFEMDGHSAEAAFKVEGRESAIRILKTNARARGEPEDGRKTLLLPSSSR
jgi:DnaJ domain